MKLCEYIKNINKRTFKICGMIMYEKSFNDEKTVFSQRFLAGSFSTEKTQTDFGDNSQKTIKLFNIPLFKEIKKGNIKELYFFKMRIRKYSIVSAFQKKYKKHFASQYDQIYILNSNSGEAYCFLTYLFDEYKKRNQAQNPLLVATKNYHVQLIKMLCPEFPYILINNFKYLLKNVHFKIGKQKFYIMYPQNHFAKVQKKVIQNYEKANYFDEMLIALGLDKNSLSMRKAKISEKATNSMLQKAKEIGLDLNKFVFLSPEALSCKGLKTEFWTELISKYQEKGYDIFVNAIKEDTNLSKSVNYKSCFLTFEEALAMAKLSKKIVTLRSGFTEFLMQSGVEITAIYTPFSKEMTVEQSISGFGMHNLPFFEKEKIAELNSEKMNHTEFIDSIVESTRA